MIGKRQGRPSPPGAFGLGPRHIPLVVALAVSLVLSAILAGQVSASAAPTAAVSRSSTAPCQRVARPRPKHRRFRAPGLVVAAGEALSAVVRTNCGVFRIALDTGRAPLTVDSFSFLAERHFYDGLTFHRVVRNFVIQGGDPLGTGTGGPGYRVIERPPANLDYTRGVVAMAKAAAEPNGASGSQFFVVTARDAGLPPEYALIGRVSSGMDVVERIDRLGRTDEKPRQTVLIESISITRP